MSLGLGATLSSLNNEHWTPKRLPDLLYWFRFRTGITTDDALDVTEWRDEKEVGWKATGDGGASTSPDLEADGTIKFHSGTNVLTFPEVVLLGTYSLYFKLNWDEADTIGANEDLVEHDADNFFKLTSPTTVRFKIAGHRHDFTIQEITEGVPFVLGTERDANGLMSVFFNDIPGEPDEGEGEQAVENLLKISQFGKPTQTSYWYEVVICNNALSTTNRNNLYKYLYNVG